jgi:hypothetical protein
MQNGKTQRGKLKKNEVTNTSKKRNNKKSIKKVFTRQPTENACQGVIRVVVKVRELGKKNEEYQLGIKEDDKESLICGC